MANGDFSTSYFCVMHYREQYRVPPAFLLVIGISAITTVTILLAVGWSDLWAFLNGKPTEEGATLFWGFIGILVLEALVAWMISSWCHVEMDAQGFRIKYPPIILRWKSRPWSQVTQITITQICPIGDLGGWGLRIGSVGPFRRAHVYAFEEGTYALFTLQSGRTVGMNIQRTADFRVFLETMVPSIPVLDSGQRLG